MTDVTDIESEGEAREYVEANPEEAVHIMDTRGGIYLFINEDGDFDVTLEWDNGRVEEGPVMGDDFQFPDRYEVVGTVDVDEVPDREGSEDPIERLLEDLDDALEEAGVDADAEGVLRE